MTEAVECFGLDVGLLRILKFFTPKLTNMCNVIKPGIVSHIFACDCKSTSRRFHACTVTMSLSVVLDCIYYRRGTCLVVHDCNALSGFSIF